MEVTRNSAPKKGRIKSESLRAYHHNVHVHVCTCSYLKLLRLDLGEIFSSQELYNFSSAGIFVIGEFYIVTFAQHII